MFVHFSEIISHPIQFELDAFIEESVHLRSIYIGSTHEILVLCLSYFPWHNLSASFSIYTLIIAVGVNFELWYFKQFVNFPPTLSHLFFNIDMFLFV